MAATGGKRPGAGRKPGKVGQAKRELMVMAKEHAEQALLTLVEITGNTKEPSAARVSAATAILDRGYGRPSQAVNHSGTVALVTVTPDQLAKLDKDELAALEAAYPVLQKLGLVGSDPGGED